MTSSKAGTYPNPDRIERFSLDPGEYINKIYVYYGSAVSAIDGGVFNMMVGMGFETNLGKLITLETTKMKRNEISLDFRKLLTEICALVSPCPFVQQWS